jgi:hypothetical protein
LIGEVEAFFGDFAGEAQPAMSASARERTVGGSFCEILPSQKLPKKGDRTITFSENSRDQRMVPFFYSGYADYYPGNNPITAVINPLIWCNRRSPAQCQ